MTRIAFVNGQTPAVYGANNRTHNPLPRIFKRGLGFPVADGRHFLAFCGQGERPDIEGVALVEGERVLAGAALNVYEPIPAGELRRFRVGRRPEDETRLSSILGKVSGTETCQFRPGYPTPNDVGAVFGFMTFLNNYWGVFYSALPAITQDFLWDLWLQCQTISRTDTNDGDLTQLQSAFCSWNDLMRNWMFQGRLGRNEIRATTVLPELFGGEKRPAPQLEPLDADFWRGMTAEQRRLSSIESSVRGFLNKVGEKWGNYPKDMQAHLFRLCVAHASRWDSELLGIPVCNDVNETVFLGDPVVADKWHGALTPRLFERLPKTVKIDRFVWQEGYDWTEILRTEMKVRNLEFIDGTRLNVTGGEFAAEQMAGAELEIYLADLKIPGQSGTAEKIIFEFRVPAATKQMLVISGTLPLQAVQSLPAWEKLFEMVPGKSAEVRPAADALRRAGELGRDGTKRFLTLTRGLARKLENVVVAPAFSARYYLKPEPPKLPAIEPELLRAVNLD